MRGQRVRWAGGRLDAAAKLIATRFWLLRHVAPRGHRFCLFFRPFTTALPGRRPLVRVAAQGAAVATLHTAFLFCIPPTLHLFIAVIQLSCA